jgi:TolB-like protein
MARVPRSLFLVILVAIASSLGAQVAVDRPRVVVLPVENASGNPQYDAAALTVRDTIVLVLRLIGTYELVDAAPDDVPETYGAGSIAAFAEAQGVDNVIYGEITVPDTGGIRFDMSLFDRGVGEVVLQEERVAQSVLDLFDTTDIIVRDFIGAFSGIRIGFGTIALRPSDPDISYNVYVDGKLLGQDLRTINQVLIGERQIEIRQVSVGGETVVLQEQFTLEEGATARFTVELLQLTAADRAYLADLRERVEQRLPGPFDLDGAEEAIALIGEFLAAHPGSMPAQEELHADDRVRLELARDFELIEGYEWTAPPQTPAQTRPAWENFMNDVSERAATVVAATRDDDDTPLRWEALRNLAAVMEMIRLLVADSVATVSYEDMTRNRIGYLRFLRTYPEPYTYSGEFSRYTRAVQRYERQDRQRTPTWHLIAAGTGLAAAGYGGYIYATDPMTPLIEEADEWQVLYEASTDVDEISALRSDIESNYRQANFQNAIMWGGLTGGAALVTTAIVARMFSVRRAERKLDKYADDDWPFEIAAAEQVLNAEFGPGDAGVLITNRGRPIVIDGQRYPSPYYVERAAGDVFEVFGGWPVAEPNPGNPINAFAEVVVEPGLNVVVLK